MKQLLTILTLLVVTSTYGQVGISTTSTFTPTETLDVDGTLRVNNNVYIGTTSGTNNDIYISDDIIDWDNTSYYLDMGGVSRINEINFDEGTTNDPSVYFEDTNTGFYAPSAGQIGITINGSEAIRIDANRDVGIGITNPIAKLDVVQASASATGGVVEMTSTNSGYSALEGGLNNSNTSNSPIAVLGLSSYSGLSDVFNYGVYGEVDNYVSTGVLGVRVNNGGNDLGFGGLFVNDLGYTGVLLNVSDGKLKTNVTNLENALVVVNRLRPVTYNYDTETYPNMGLTESMEYGLIAQEVAEVLPTITKTKMLPKNPSRRLGEATEVEMEEVLMMDYTRLIPILVKAIQEQQEVIEDLENRICDLECVVD